MSEQQAWSQTRLVLGNQSITDLLAAPFLSAGCCVHHALWLPQSTTGHTALTLLYEGETEAPGSKCLAPGLSLIPKPEIFL